VYTSNDFSIKNIVLNVIEGSKTSQWKGPIYFKRNAFSWEIYNMRELCKVGKNKRKCYKK
jgi:hypothetical protein